MKLISQDSYNECGICCANMLINHFTKQNEDLRPALLNECNLTKYGLSILELEELCSKNNIILNSFESTWEEIICLKDKNPIIFILRRNNNYHYVLGFVNNKKITIYDPEGRKYLVQTKDDFLEWTGYLCLVTYNKIKFKKVDVSLPLFKNFNFFINLAFFIINLLKFISNISISFLMSKLMNLNYINIINEDLWKISFIFLTLVFINTCFNYLNNYFKYKYFNQNYRFLINNFLLVLNNKNFYFFECYQKQEIKQFFELNIHLLEFYCFYWSDLISNLFIFLFSLLIILAININLIFILLLITLIKTIFILNFLNLDKKIQNNIIINQTKIENNLDNLLDFKTYNQNFYKEKLWSNNIANNLVKLSETKFMFDNKKNLLNLFYTIFEHCINYLLLIFLWKSQSFNIGTLFLLLSLFNLNNDNLDSVMSSCKQLLQIKPIYQHILSIYSTNNINPKNKLKIDKPNYLDWKNNIFKNNLLIDIVDLTNHPLIFGLLKQHDPLNEIKINNCELSSINELNLKENVLLIDYSYSIKKKDAIKILNYINNNYQLDMSNSINWSKYNFYKLNPEIKIILVLFSLLNEKNKIICFNNFFINVDKDIEDFILKILKEININNFLIANNRSNYLLTYYEYQI